MNKTELVESISKESGLSKKDAAAALDATLNGIKNALAEGDSVSILGFGTFSVKERPERQGRNPATGEAMTIKASKSPVFKAGKGLKDVVK
ncbi:MAG: HU family DNA-binding protein [Blautia sp.]|nr:HU family DNA-binding protein [Blautia sp.]